MKLSKEIIVVIAVQVVSLVVMLVFINWSLKGIKTESAASSDTSAINALSSRLGQVQVDLYQIKAKLGAGNPSAINQPKQ